MAKTLYCPICGCKLKKDNCGDYYCDHGDADNCSMNFSMPLFVLEMLIEGEAAKEQLKSHTVKSVIPKPLTNCDADSIVAMAADFSERFREMPSHINSTVEVSKLWDAVYYLTKKTEDLQSQIHEITRLQYRRGGF